MESVQTPGVNVLKMLFGSITKNPATETKTVVSTIDGDIISQNAMDIAVKTGKGVMIGGFLVGSAHSSDSDYGYSLSI